MTKPQYSPIQIPLPLENETFEIPLTRGQVAIVDAVDADLVSSKWRAQKHRNGFYAARWNGGGSPSYQTLHRVILSRMMGRPLETSELADHIDCDTLNNRRSNLRLATKADNNRNTKNRRSNTSGRKGVCWCKANSKWQAYISVMDRQIHLGFYDDIEAAHAAYCEAAKKYHGEFARFE